MRYFIYIGIIFGCSSAVAAREVTSIEKRVAELERRQEESFIEMAQGKGRAKTFLQDTIFLGGFFENAITHIVGPNTDSQVSANENTLGINISAEFNEDLRFVTQILTNMSFALQNLQNDPRGFPPKREFSTLTSGSLLPQAYFEYSFSPDLDIQMGIGYVPFGYAFQQRDLVLFQRRGGPQMINAGSFHNVAIASQFWQGLHVSGTFQLSDTRLGYHLYTLTPLTNAKTLGGGARLWWRPLDSMTVGLSQQTGQTGDGTFYQSYGGDVHLSYGRWGLTFEYARNFLSSGGASPLSYYVEPSFSFFKGALIVYGVADYLDNPTNVTESLVQGFPDPYKQWRLGGGLNWIPFSYTRFRLGYLVHNYVGDTAIIAGQDRRYYSLDLSAGVEF